MSYIFRFRNTATGEVVEVSGDEARVGRMRRRVRAWGRSATMLGDRIMITLTYRQRDGWSARHVSAFMKRVRRCLGDALFAYAWVAELQRRGAVHYHVVLVVRRGARIPKPDEAGWWPYGMTRVEKVRGADRAGRYLMKYVQKGDRLGGLPRGLRLFAVTIRRAFSSASWWLRWWSTPSWLRAVVGSRGGVRAEVVLLRRVAGGWEVDGEFYRSPWRLDAVMAALSPGG